MKKILQIQRNKIHFESGEIFDCGKELIYLYSLKEGKELNEKEYEKLIFDLILSKTYFLLSRKDYTLKELEMKLFFRYKNKEIIQKVLENLKEKSYINEFDYIINYVRSKKYGRKRLEYELMKKGIKKELINEAYKEIEIDEKEEIKKFLPKIKDKDKNKQINFLMRKGFSIGDILDTLR